jgi:DNA processing protein
MLSEQELLYTLALQRAPNLGDTSAKKLLRAVGSAKAIFEERKSALLKIDGIGALRLKELNEAELLPLAEAELQFVQKQGIECLYFKDTAYPEKLKHCIDGPILLFQRGSIDLKNKKLISIVGTRKATIYGTSFCEQLIEELAPLQPVIISGFAYGIDITAHKAAMQHNLQTIGCLAHGLNQIYPKVHKKYVADLHSHGGFITEFWSDDPFDRTNFLKRNRVIAGMAEATIVIESAAKGGSLVTADIANSYNREVFALPGRSTDIQSQGCNNLIKTQQAHMITSAADLLYILGWEPEEKSPSPRQTQLFVTLDGEEKTIFDYLTKKEAEQLDVISLECNMPTFKVATILLNLELKGMVRPLPGKRFQAV